MKIARYALLLLLTLLLAAAPVSGAAKYTVTEIVLPAGTEPFDPYGHEDIFFDINDNGVVAGWYYIQGTTYEFGAYRWENGVLTVLPTLPGDDNTKTRAFAINKPGQIAGCSGTMSTSNACLWPGAAPFTPAALPDGGAKARGINDLGQVVGNNTSWAVLWKDGARTTLPGLSTGFGDAYGINENGAMAGVSWAPLSGDDVFQWPVLWPDSTSIINLGDFGAWPDSPKQRGGKAFALNDRNQVVGYAHAPIPPYGGWRAFLWEDDGLGLKDLGCLKTEYDSNSMARALDINNAGQIVGWSTAYHEGDQSFGYKAVLWEKGAIIDLNTRIDPIPEYYLYQAQAINNKGQVVCLARDFTFVNYRIYLLTPVSSPAAINLLLLDD